MKRGVSAASTGVGSPILASPSRSAASAGTPALLPASMQTEKESAGGRRRHSQRCHRDRRDRRASDRFPSFRAPRTPRAPGSRCRCRTRCRRRRSPAPPRWRRPHRCSPTESCSRKLGFRWCARRRRCRSPCCAKEWHWRARGSPRSRSRPRGGVVPAEDGIHHREGGRRAHRDRAAAAARVIPTEIAVPNEERGAVEREAAAGAGAVRVDFTSADRWGSRDDQDPAAAPRVGVAVADREAVEDRRRADAASGHHVETVVRRVAERADVAAQNRGIGLRVSLGKEVSPPANPPKTDLPFASWNVALRFPVPLSGR